ncbi:MAG: DUF116 domain-containing protein [Actinobacteria bacterium]|nr:DUF116 domain-containing protein [Actinomycetota bacterium]
MTIELLKEQKNVKKIEEINFGERVLLISHCLRSSKLCNAKFSKDGLVCLDDCPNKCSIGKLRNIAEKLGYKDICIAPGGKMALKFIQEKQPCGIIAIACKKELDEGIKAIKSHQIKNKLNNKIPVIVTIPLLRDGCVDTKVDIELAIKIINAGNGVKNDSM